MHTEIFIHLLKPFLGRVLSFHFLSVLAMVYFDDIQSYNLQQSLFQVGRLSIMCSEFKSDLVEFYSLFRSDLYDITQRQKLDWNQGLLNSRGGLFYCLFRIKEPPNQVTVGYKRER